MFGPSPSEPTDSGVPPLRAHLLGRVRLAVGDREIPDHAWPRRAARSLVLLLLASPDHLLTRHRALDALWPNVPPQAARASFYQALSTLRRVLEPDLPKRQPSAYLDVGPAGIGLRPAPRLWVDVDAFETALAHAASASAKERHDHVRAALDLYTDDLLADEPATDWAAGRREDLRLARRRAILDLADLDLSAGSAHDSIGLLEALLATDAAFEEAHRALMRAYAVTGQRNRALRQFERCRHVLETELGVVPDEATQSLYVQLQQAAPQPVHAPLATQRLQPRPALPAPATPLVGRQRELTIIQDLLWNPEVRLVTLTGPGGAGKTRLALEAAASVENDFAAGACFVPLAAISDAEAGLPAIARTLGIWEAPDQPIMAELQNILQNQELLLTLDNLEQIASIAPSLANLLAACPKLTLLTTSRQPLHIRAEHEIAIPPLALPQHKGHSSISALARIEAVALFVQRARAVSRDFTLTEANAAGVAEICRRLDGLPLAIELAAARIKVLTPQAMLSRFDQLLHLLTDGPCDLPERQRSLRTAIAWSHDFLSPAEQAFFRRLSIFTGGFTLDAAEAVAGSGLSKNAAISSQSSGLPLRASPQSSSVLDTITALVNHSLLRPIESHPPLSPRFEMLETIREYGIECLEASSEAEAVRWRHAAWCLSLAEAGEPEVIGPRPPAWLDQIEREQDNLRAALAWAHARSTAETIVRLSCALWWFWRMRGHLNEGRDWFRHALALGIISNVSPALRARALLLAGDLAWVQGDLPRATALGEASLAIWTDLNHQSNIAKTLFFLGEVALTQGMRIEQGPLLSGLSPCSVRWMTRTGLR